MPYHAQSSPEELLLVVLVALLLEVIRLELLLLLPSYCQKPHLQMLYKCFHLSNRMVHWIL
jgi:hypothetical protein